MMMSPHSFVLTSVFVLMMAVIRVLPAVEPSRPSMCVVGGGITGLVIADKLLDAGESVVLFEQSSDHIGGKLDTVRSWGVVWEKGPVLYSSGEESIRAYIAKFNLTNINWSGQNVAYFDPTTSTPSTISEAQLVEMRKNLIPLAEKYVGIWTSYPPWLFEPRGFEHVHLLKDSHPDLFLSTDEWLAFHGLSGMRFVFSIVFTCEGYGNLRDLPVLYALKLLKPQVIQALGNLILGGDSFVNHDIYTVEEGFAELAYRIMNKIRSHKNGLVFMDHKLVYIFRKDFEKNKDHVHLRFYMAQGTVRLPTVKWCKKVVLAFPPLLFKLTPLLDDLSLDEKTVLGAVKVNKYFSSGQILEDPVWDKFVYLGLGNNSNSWESGDGRPIALVRSGKGAKNAYIVYSWLYGRYDSGPQPSDYSYVDDRLLYFLYQFKAGPPKLSFLEGYEYFPHVTGREMADGWFDNFAAMQGFKGIYYATTATSFESVNTAIENAEAVAQLMLYD